MNPIETKNRSLAINIEKLLSQDIEKKFYKLIIELKKQLKDEFVFEKKSVDGLQKELNKQIILIKKLISSLYLKMDKYTETGNNPFLSAAERDLNMILEALKSLQAEFYTTFFSVLQKDVQTKRIIFESNPGKEISVYLNSLEETLKEVRNALK
jgi:hypothetical protein